MPKRKEEGLQCAECKKTYPRKNYKKEAWSNDLFVGVDLICPKGHKQVNHGSVQKAC